MRAILGRHSARLSMVGQHATADTGQFVNRRGVSDNQLRGKLETSLVRLHSNQRDQQHDQNGYNSVSGPDCPPEEAVS